MYMGVVGRAVVVSIVVSTFLVIFLVDSFDLFKLKFSNRPTGSGSCETFDAFRPPHKFTFRYFEFCDCEWKFCAFEGDFCTIGSDVTEAKFGIGENYWKKNFTMTFKCERSAFNLKGESGAQHICLIRDLDSGEKRHCFGTSIGFYDDHDKVRGNVFDEKTFHAKAPSSVRKMTFVTYSSEYGVIQTNLLSSQAFLREESKHELLRYDPKGKLLLPAAYRDGLKRAANDIVVFIHPDSYLPPFWEERIEQRIQDVEKFDKNWAFLANACVDGPSAYCDNGFATCRMNNPDPKKPCRFPDENIIIVNRRSQISWDEKYPSHHAFGALMWLETESRGLKGYGVNHAISFHKWKAENGKLLDIKAQDSWFQVYQREKPMVERKLVKYFAKHWKKYLPITTLTFRFELN